MLSDNNNIDCICIQIVYGIVGPVPTKDMQTPPLSFDSIFMEDPQFAETNEKSIFLFLFFRVIVKIYQKMG